METETDRGRETERMHYLQNRDYLMIAMCNTSKGKNGASMQDWD